MPGYASHCLAELALLLLEKTHALADEVGETAVRAGMVVADETFQIVVREQRIGSGFLLQDDLQQESETNPLFSNDNLE